MNNYTQIRCEDVVAVIVTYLPNEFDLQMLIQSIDSQVKEIVIVDNSDDNSYFLDDIVSINNKIKIINLPANYGIGYAQNKGIEYALSISIEYVLLLDQDSLPEENMVFKLKNALETTLINNEFYPMVAAPIVRDKKLNKNLPFVNLKGTYLIKSSIKQVTLIEQTISSGLLVKMKAIELIGGMRSDYFIDCVDTEWLLRLVSKGQFIIGVSEAQLEHSLGDRVKRVWLFRWRNIVIHSPFRMYYQTRNNLLMLNEFPFSIKWKIIQLFYSFRKNTSNLVFGDKRFSRLQFLLFGIHHGLKGYSGKLNTQLNVLEPIPLTNIEYSNK